MSLDDAGTANYHTLYTSSEAGFVFRNKRGEKKELFKFYNKTTK